MGGGTTMAAGIVWGPVGVWVGATATLVTAVIAVLAASGRFDAFRAPKLRLTFQAAEPWVRTVEDRWGEAVVWVRVGVENAGASPARGCVGRLTSLRTGKTPRVDVDPVQLRWAGVPRSRALVPVDLRRGQREFLNVLYSTHNGEAWAIATFQEPDFDPGFTTTLLPGAVHSLEVAVFSDNANTTTMHLELGPGGITTRSTR